MVYPILKLYLILIINLLNIKQYKEKTDNPPNIFIYISDDQNQWDYGVYGNPEVSTTAADRLAKEGIRFKESEQPAAELFNYKWGHPPSLFSNNSHSPKGKTIKGIKYE